MNLILPKYMLGRKNFECPRCSFKFYKHTPSRVEKCPQCTTPVFDTTYKKGETLDPYSASKLRWATSEQRHADEIKKRKIKYINGKQVVANTDDKGRLIDFAPTYDVKGTKMGISKEEGQLK